MAQYFNSIQFNQLIGALFLLFLAGCNSVNIGKPSSLDVVTQPFKSSEINYAWIQLGDQNTASARVILPGVNVSCPNITVGSNTSQMTVRSIPSNYNEFNNAITVCEHLIKSTTDSIFVDNAGTPLKLPSSTGNSDTFLVLGDTGCRLKHRDRQLCKGGSVETGMWGFPTLSLSAEADQQTDLILHVGDYIYRESTSHSQPELCKHYDPSKGWVNCGDNWPTWQADFFEPANASTPQNNNSLLLKAPWIFVRGNHENCTRSWQGYYLFFADGDAPNECGTNQAVIAPYSVQLADLDIHVVDTSNEDAHSAATSFNSVKNNMATNTKLAWLTTHVPMAFLGSAYANSGLPELNQLKWIHVGHEHLFQHSAASRSQQAQTITGGSGTELDACNSLPICGLSRSGGDCCYGSDQGGYSYMTIDFNSDPGNTQWNATLKSVYGNKVHTFNVE